MVVGAVLLVVDLPPWHSSRCRYATATLLIIFFSLSCSGKQQDTYILKRKTCRCRSTQNLSSTTQHHPATTAPNDNTPESSSGSPHSSSSPLTHSSPCPPPHVPYTPCTGGRGSPTKTLNGCRPPFYHFVLVSIHWHCV